MNLTRPSADAKDRYTTQLTTFCEQVAALVHVVPTVQNVTEDHVLRWINWRREQPIGSSPKTISNYHGMLYSLFAAAIKMDLRRDNPCDGHRLPDRNTVNADGDAPELSFLSEEQFALIADCMFPDEMYDRGDTGRNANGYLTTAAKGHWAGMIEDRWLIEADVLTGMRWGEITALKVKDVELIGTAMSRRQPFVQVSAC